jgi:hypothetical protein
VIPTARQPRPSQRPVFHDAKGFTGYIGHRAESLHRGTRRLTIEATINLLLTLRG